MNKIFTAFIMCFFAGWCASSIQASVLYVKPGASSTAWQSKTNVYPDLGSALTAAVSGDEIWVATGTYKPTTGTDRSICYNLKEGVAVYGGFLGTETLLTQRNWSVNQTILSGDIGVQGTKTDNSYHVMKAIGTAALPITGSTRVDGLILENGYANGANDYGGGALYLEYATPVMVNLIMRNNYADGHGGAVYLKWSATEFYNVLFVSNIARNGGGAVSTFDYSLKFNHCTFIGNHSDYEGGALACYNNYPTITNSIAWGNSAKSGDSQFTNSYCTYSCVQGGQSGVGNISSEPLMIDMANGDYRLNANSPCIDKGLAANTPAWLTTDLSGAARNVGASVDMGVFEGGVPVPSILTPANKTLLASTATSATLSWEWLVTMPNDVTDYEIEIQRNGGASEYYNSSSLSFSYSGLLVGSSYQWRVRAVDGTSLKNWTPWFLFAVPRNTPIYVKSGASGDGSSWTNAFGSIQAAINSANYGESIWVAAGTYYPTALADRTISITLKDGVAIYGGFAGTETSLTERSWTKNPTILSGDIGVVNDKSDNSYHVVTAIGSATNAIGSDTRIDGFILENGYGNTNPVSNGGAIFISYASPTIVNVLARNNFTSGYGGAISAFNSNSLIVNCIFTNNKASNDGGAVYSDSPLSIFSCTFYKNTSGSFGGAISGSWNRDITVMNCILWGNTAWSPYYLQEMYTNADYSDIEGGSFYNYNVDSDPLMNDPDNGDFRLTRSSPCFNTGSSSATPAWLLTDFEGNTRLSGTRVDMGAYEGYVITPVGTAPANKAVISPAATSVNLQWEWKETAPAGITGYEVEVVANGGTSVYYSTSSTSFNFTNLSATTEFKWRVRTIYGAPFKEWSPWSTFCVPHAQPIFVKEGAAGNGESWASPFGSLQDAIAAAMLGDTIWVAAGTYKPTATTDRTISFNLKEGVVIGGGFAGTETKWAERNWVVNSTILSGDIGVENNATDNSYHVVNCAGTSTNLLTNKTQLNGVIIENGYADDTNYSSNNKGGAVYIIYASPEITNVVIRNNYATYGGGIYCYKSTALFYNCLLFNNIANDDGGAVYALAPISFSHSVFYGNSAGEYSGAVYANTNFNITNSIAWGNSAGSYYENFYGSYAQCTYSCIEEGYTGTGNISTNPLWIDAAGGDFRLNINSPCIDKGSNSGTPTSLLTDFGGNARLAGTTVDMGAFEGGVIVPITKLPLNNTVINPSSAAVKLEWGWDATTPSDITGYEVEIVPNGGSSTFVSATALFIDFDALQPATSYQWRVRGIDGSIFKDWSDWSTFVVPHNRPLYVKTDGTGDGSSWATAYGDLQTAINNALNGDTIWVAAGTYKPTSGIDRTISFSLKDGVHIYGGFAGAELKLSERNWVANLTILSGDIGVIDTDTDNSYHVLTAVGTATSTVSQNTRVDGVIIEKGYADGSNSPHNRGGGIYLYYGNPIICNVLIRNNYTIGDGGGVYANYSNTPFQNCQFIGNKARSGGAAYTVSSTSYTHCLIANNYATYSGRAIYGEASFELTNSIVWGNTSSANYSIFNYANCNYCCIEGGYSGDGIVSSNPLFVDASSGDYRLLAASPCIDKGINSGTPAGLTTDFLGSDRLQGTTVDIGPYEGGVLTPKAILPLNGAVVDAYAAAINLEWEWSSTIPNDITGYEIELTDGDGVVTTVISSTTTYTFSSFQESTTYTWRVRGVDATNIKNWSASSTFNVPHNHPLYVKEGSTGDGSSWELAFGDLQDAINESFASDTIWVATGTYFPTTTTDRTISFNLKDGVAVYGGFAGTETKLLERNWVTNPTILSGDIGVVDTDTDNSYHVVSFIGTTEAPISSESRLDGFVIEKGYADRIYDSNNNGGAIYLIDANPLINNVMMRNNYALRFGGAIYATNSEARFVNCQLLKNECAFLGGAVYASSASSTVSFINCLLVDNHSDDSGGAAYGSKFVNSIIWGNTDKYSSQLYYSNCTYSCIQDGHSGTGNILDDPLFIDAENGDYHLNITSPAIDKGSNDALSVMVSEDYDGHLRQIGTSVDMGPYEGGVSTPSIKYPLNNAIINPKLTTLKLEWEWASTMPEGITGYEVEIQANGGTSEYLSATETSLNFTSLSLATGYQWRVRGVDASVTRNWSPWSSFTVPHNHPLYVKTDGAGDGSSWLLAYGDLQTAISESVTGDSIWIAAGTYKPTSTTDRLISFNLKAGVAIYGGFAGTESLLTERNWIINPTILSGDIGEEGVDTDNSQMIMQVVGTASFINKDVKLDGLIIEKGYANITLDAISSGSGLYVNYATPEISNTIFRNNYALGTGGAVYQYNGNSVFNNCQFLNNKTSASGGAVYAVYDLTLNHCLFYNNRAESYGGALSLNYVSNAKVNNSIAWGNTAGLGYNHFNNVTCTSCCVEGGYSGSNNISTDPLFVDAANGDFRLLAASPCINKGDNSLTPASLLTDFSGRVRLAGTAVDMGPFEGGVATPVAKSPTDKVVLLPSVTSVTLEWQWPATMPDGITGYEIEVTGENGSSDLYSSDALTFDVTSLSSANTYQWRVRGIDGTFYKNWSEWSSFIIPHNRPIYVKAGSVGNGSSWLSAYGSLQDALNDALPTDTIWVAAGTYKPTTTTDRSVNFKMKEGVAIYGGFDGSESKLSERNWVTNSTILSGDIGVTGTDTDNSYHVVKIMGTNDVAINNCRMDGFIIEKGYGDGSATDDRNGGAVKIYRAHPQMMNIVFRDNYVGNFGGAIYANVCNSTFTNCQFINNQSNGDGGAVYSVNTLEFVNCLFTKNKANWGAAHYGSSACYFYNSIVWDNTAVSSVISNANCKYSCIQGGHSGTGNINADPLFADAANGNYHLMVNSPCLDKGSNDNMPATLTHDMDGLPRVIGNAIDMGPYEAIFVKELTPANNEILKQQGMMGGNLYWDLDQSIDNEQLPVMNYHVRLWDKATPQIATIENTVFNKYTMSFYPAIPFAATYQWQVGVEVNNHIYQSEVATVYVGRENPIYVKPNGTGDGSTWELALGSVSDALDIANPGDRIWVAAGTYKPKGDGKEASFKLKPFVELTGGYIIDEIVGQSWNPAKNATILSGDIGTAGDATDNVYHVINNTYTADAPLIGAVIDGFTITGGNAATANGGGMLNVNANPKIRNCKFSGNSAASGGAIYNEASSPTILNSLLNSNTSTSSGSAICSDANSLPVIINCTVAGNTASSGGAVAGSGTVGNTIVYSNTGGQVSGTASYTYSCIEGGLAGEGNISASPRFVDAAKGDYRIGPFTSCFEMGNNDLVPNDISYRDLSFAEGRIFVSKVDIGAYELKFPYIAARIKIVQSNPDSAAVGVDYKTPVELTFNEPITILDPAGIRLESGESFQSMTLSADKKTLTLTPSNVWPFESTQKLLFDFGAIRFADNTNFRMEDDVIPFTVRACQPAALTVTTSSNAVCPDMPVTVTAEVTGNALDNYSWTLGASEPFALNASSFEIQTLNTDSVGVYTCNVSDMCGLTTSAQTTVALKQGVLTPVIHKKWDAIYLVDNSSLRFNDYKWYVDNRLLNSGNQYIKVTNANADLYVVAFDATSGCWSTSDTTITSAGSSKVSVYPNPVVRSQSLKISLGQESANVKVKLFDINGRLVSMTSYDNIDEVTYDDTNLDTGVYTLEISTDEAVTQVKLVIK